MKLPAQTPLIDFRKVSVNRGPKTVLKEIQLYIRRGEHLAIIGPNGSGKSTLIKTITRELYPVQGIPRQRFHILGHDAWNVFELRRWLGIVQPDLYQHPMHDCTVREAVLSGFFSGVGLWPQDRVTVRMERKCREVLDFLEIETLIDRDITQLSSGELRRVLIGRALVHDPQALVLDEPTNSLDPKAHQEFLRVARKIAQSSKSVIMVTHQLQDVIPEIERIVLLRGGSIYKDGPKDRLLTSSVLSRLFGVSIKVACQNGHYAAIPSR